jgi:hypothetical protein
VKNGAKEPLDSQKALKSSKSKVSTPSHDQKNQKSKAIKKEEPKKKGRNAIKK